MLELITASEVRGFCGKTCPRSVWDEGKRLGRVQHVGGQRGLNGKSGASLQSWDKCMNRG